MTSGNPKHKSEKQLYTKKALELFMTRDKNVFIYLMIMQKLDLKPFTNQNEINR